jgi:hypothetical protein
MATAVPLKSGFLYKKVPLRRNLQKRWFVLHTDGLYYYKDQPTGTKNASKPLGCLEIQDISTVQAIDDSSNKKLYSFEMLAVSEEKAVQLAAETDEERQRWISIIQTVTKKLAKLPPSARAGGLKPAGSRIAGIGSRIGGKIIPRPPPTVGTYYYCKAIFKLKSIGN